MAMSSYKIRIIANACITRYDSAEGTMIDIITNYNLAKEDRVLVISEVIAKLPNIQV
ncbi:hypothetical protein AB4Z45_18705 [Paenibacillus sp. MCAF9]